MPSVETRAIILRTYNLAEADKVVVCFTEASGMVRGVARGARRLKSRYGAGLEPWTLIRIAYFEKEGRELVSLKGVDIERSSFALATDAEASATLAYMSALVLEFMPPHEKNALMFRMMVACMEALVEEGVGKAAIASYFETWTLRLSGVLPDVSVCAQCHRQLTEGEAAKLGIDTQIRCTDCGRESDMKISAAVRKQIQLIQRVAPCTYAQTSGYEKTREELNALLKRLTHKALERLPRALETLQAR
ncbi:MAG: DNA repair protein RecO [Pyrinomonadaceae bacterium MAG19_C2-C3]|nr:DNA repair protein RecO [Pyrinomonadaceae bacterium MAG19_C2-C3]